jgi:hypothetical protein
MIVWRIGQPGPALPGDGPVEPGLRGLPLPGAGHRVHDWEIQVIPGDLGGHDALADDLAPAAEVLGWGGGPSRWLAWRDGSKVLPVFSPTWRAEQSADLEDALRGWAARPDVAAIRVIPGLPVGLEEAAATLDPAVWLGEGRWIVRWRDGARAGDRVVATVPRDRSESDGPLLSSLVTTFRQARSPRPLETEHGFCRLVADEVGQAGAEIRWPASLFDTPSALPWAISPLLTAPLPGCSTILDLGFFSDGPRVMVWADAEYQPPLWVSAG